MAGSEEREERREEGRERGERETEREREGKEGRKKEKEREVEKKRCGRSRDHIVQILFYDSPLRPPHTIRGVDIRYITQPQRYTHTLETKLVY